MAGLLGGYLGPGGLAAPAGLLSPAGLTLAACRGYLVQMVTKYKLGYDPVEVDPEDMVGGLKEGGGGG